MEGGGGISGPGRRGEMSFLAGPLISGQVTRQKSFNWVNKNLSEQPMRSGEFFFIVETNMI